VRNVFLARALDFILRYTVNDSSKQIVFLAVPKEHVFDTRTFIDGTLKKVAPAVIGMLLIAATAVSGATAMDLVQPIAILALCTSVALMPLCLRLAHDSAEPDGLPSGPEHRSENRSSQPFAIVASSLLVASRLGSWRQKARRRSVNEQLRLVEEHEDHVHHMIRRGSTFMKIEALEMPSTTRNVATNGRGHMQRRCACQTATVAGTGAQRTYWDARRRIAHYESFWGGRHGFVVCA